MALSPEQPLQDDLIGGAELVLGDLLRRDPADIRMLQLLGFPLKDAGVEQGQVDSQD